MTGADLRPLSLGELLDRTFTLYRNHFWLFVGIMALPQLVMVILSLLLQDLMTPVIAVPAPGGPPPAPAQMAQMIGGFFLGALLMGVLYIIVYALALGATTFAVSDIYLGRKATVRSAYRNMRGRYRSLLGLIFIILVVLVCCYLALAMMGALVGLVLAIFLGPFAVMVGILAGAALCVWVLLHFGVAVPALLLEKIGVFQAMTRSTRLTKGHLRWVFMTLVLMLLVSYDIVIVLQGPFLAAILMSKGGQIALWLRSVTVILGGASRALSGPFLMIGLSLFYYDARVRKEAFDLQVMMAALGLAAPPAGATSPSDAGTTGPSPAEKA